MRASLFKTFGVSIAALVLSLSLVTNPVVAGTWHGGGGGWHGGGGGGGWHGGGSRWGGGGWHGRGGGWRGGYGGYGNGYGYGGYRNGDWGPALGLGLLGAGIIASQYPYSDTGYGYGAPYGSYPQAGGGDSAYCANRFRSYDPASGTYLGYDGLRHPCP